MLFRTLALTVLLPAIGSTAAAQIQIVQQTRSISGSCSAGSGPGGNMGDGFTHTAPSPAPFSIGDTAQASVQWAQATANAQQTSELSATRIVGTGSTGCNVVGNWSDAVAISTGASRFDVTFDVTSSLSFALTGLVTGLAVSPTPFVRLSQGATVVHEALLQSGQSAVDFSFLGVLAPGTYRLEALAHSSVGVSQWHSDSAGSSFELELVADGGAPYCFGDGWGAPCPCANHSPLGADAGCRNSLGLGAILRSEGAPSLSSDTFALLGSQMPNSNALYFQGTTRRDGLAFGDGLLCVSGTLARLGTKANTAGASRYPAAGDVPISVRGAVTSPGTRTYQVWYRNVATFCTPQTFNLTNGFEIAWRP